MESLPHLETFAEAAERGGFSAAARHLGISQAAVSQRIQQLETALRTPLFRRESGRVVLTDAGRQLHGFARRIIDLTVQAREAVTHSPGGLSGEMFLAASSVPGQHFLPHLLAEFRRNHPGVHVRVTMSSTDTVLREVEQGRAQLGMVGAAGDAPHLEFRSFAQDELVLVVPARHEWARRRQVRPNELAAQPLIQREAGSGSRRCLEQSLERAGLPPAGLNVVLELGSSEAIAGAVAEGLGVAVLSRRAVQSEVQSGRLRIVRLAGLSLYRELFVIRDRRRVLTSAAQAFLHMACQESDDV